MNNIGWNVACGAGLVAAAILTTCGASVIGTEPVASPPQTHDRIVYDLAYPVGKPKPTQKYETGVFWLNTDGTGKTQITATDGYNEGMACWAPDGSSVAYVCAIINGGSYADTLWTMNPDGSGKTRVNLPTQDLGPPAWSPDGAYIAVKGEVQNSYLQEIHLVKPNGAGLVDVLVQRLYPYFDGYLASQVSWSPDLSPFSQGYQGMLLFRYYTDQPGGPSTWDARALRVDIVNGVASFPNGTTFADSIETMGVGPITYGGVAYWSPDGHRMAWTAGGGTYVADIPYDTSGQPVFPITPAMAYPIAPSYGCSGWSPDSQNLVLAIYLTGIYRVSVPAVLSGTPPTPTRLGTDKGDRPNWSPPVF